jgi:predicted RNA binding protein YcfA (HicA-like mRNA interferase family)
MAKRDKRLEKLRQNPKNVRKDELDSVLRSAGFSPDFTAGSHVTYRHPSGARVTVAAHGAHLPAYIVKQALKAIDSLLIEDDNDENDEDEKSGYGKGDRGIP